MEVAIVPSEAYEVVGTERVELVDLRVVDEGAEFGVVGENGAGR